MGAPTFDLGAMPIFRALSDTKEQAKKLLEEASEAHVAACDYGKAATDPAYGDARQARKRAEMLGECADAAQALCNLLAAWAVTPEEWERACVGCEARNRARGRY